ncbi:hypothetical protein F5Y15DRAFT_412603 [Xylariaceae sp. FL0016]|nr:hypothetical protein F5Y15DRAFT_412603 [Xylariaceae sp. FL0016]
MAALRTVSTLHIDLDPSSQAGQYEVSSSIANSIGFGQSQVQVLAHRRSQGSKNGVLLRINVHDELTKADNIKYVCILEAVQQVYLTQIREAGVPQSIISLGTLPSGDWNTAIAVWNKDTHKFCITDPSIQVLREVKNPWHPLKIDYNNLTKVSNVRVDSGWRDGQSDFLQLVTQTLLRMDDVEKPVFMKIASFPSTRLIEAIERETAVYQRLRHTPGIAPRFLGHVTEGGRVFGFLTEYVDDAVSANEMQWSPAARADCRQAVERLHQAEIAHVDAHVENCLAKKNGGALIIDFKHSTAPPTDVNWVLWMLGLTEREHVMFDVDRKWCWYHDRIGQGEFPFCVR